MALFDCATVKRIDHSYGTRMVRVDGLIMHIAVSNSLFPSYLKGTKAHFYVRKDGTIVQEIDTAFQSGAHRQGNPYWLSVETEGGVGNDVNNGWTAAQVAALGRLYAEVARRHGTPFRLMESSRLGERGLGWHRLGIDGNFPATGLLRGRKQRGGGLLFSSAVGKLCPTDARIVQAPAILAAAQGGPVTPAPLPGTKPRLPSAEQREMLTWLGFNDTVEYQRARVLHPDGDMGPITANTLQREYDMTAASLEKKVDDLLAAINGNRIHAVVRHELDNVTSAGRPDPLTDEVGHIKDKLARQDLRYMLFDTVDGRKGVQIVATREWMIAPDEDTMQRFLDVLMFQGFTLRNDQWGTIREWWFVRGLPQGTPVQNLYALGRQVEWRPEPAAEDAPPAEVTVEVEHVADPTIKG